MNQKVIRSSILLPFIEDSYRAEYTEWNRKNLRCSDAGVSCDEGEKCERSIYYDMKFPDKKSLLTSGSLVLFDDGRLHESDIRRRLRLVLRSPERELTDDEVGARGKIDNMVYLNAIKSQVVANEALLEIIKKHDLNEDPVLELKSVNEFKFQQMAKEGKISQSYYDQVQYYLFLLIKRWAIILIKNRNSNGPKEESLPFLEFIILADSARQAQIRAGLFTTKECFEKEILPPRPFLRESTQCSFCRFKHICWPPIEEKKSVLDLGKEKIEKPSQEILDGAMRLYNQIDKEIAEKEGQKEEARKVIERYFKATKEKELLVDNIKASYSIMRKTYLDKNYLLEKLGPSKYAMVSSPTRKLIEQAISDRKIDAAILEECQKPGFISGMLRVYELKEKTGRLKPEQIKEQDDDKRNKRSKKVAKTRAHKTRDKKDKPKVKKRVSKRG